MIIPRYQDVALKMLRAESDASHPIDDDTVLICPGGTASAVVDIPRYLEEYPLTAHSRSSWARRGLHVTRDPYFHKSPYQMGVTLKNWAYYGIVIREGDTLLLTNSPQIKNLPLVEIIPLHAANQFLWVNIGIFPHAHIYDDNTLAWSIPYLDPLLPEMYGTLFKEWQYDALHLKPDTFFVVAAQEQPTIPNDCIGIVESATRNLQHASATLDQPMSRGKRALEFLTLRECCIRPGAHIATLKIYRSPVPLVPYAGKYSGQNSIVP